MRCCFIETDKIIAQMKELAAQYQAKRLYLFGSRARGDCRPGSDYDFALWGVPIEKQIKLQAAVEEMPCLYKLDLVFVSDRTASALLANIQKDGIVLMDKFESKYSSYKQALMRLRDGLAQYAQTPIEIVRDGVIQRFEFTCELALKTAREYLLDQGYTDINSPKAVMRQAMADGLVEDGDGWIDLLTDRNLTSHIYDEAVASEILERVQTKYVDLLTALLDKME